LIQKQNKAKAETKKSIQRHKYYKAKEMNESEAEFIDSLIEPE
jgi:hypothetical protein